MGNVPKFSAFVVVQLAIPLLEQRESGRQKLLGNFSPDSTMFKGVGLGDTVPCVIPRFVLSGDSQACLESTWNLDIN